MFKLPHLNMLVNWEVGHKFHPPLPHLHQKTTHITNHRWIKGWSEGIDPSLFQWNLSLFLKNLFILEDASKLLIPHIEDQFVGFVIYHSSALRNSFIDLAACSARGLLLHVV